MRNVSGGGALPVALALACALILGQAGLRANEMLASKVQAQQAINDSVVRWKKSYLALSGVEQRWRGTFQNATELPDLLSVAGLLRLEDYGLSANTDTLALKSSEPVRANHVALGLSRLCLSTGGDNFNIEADNYNALLSGLGQLAKRGDLFMDNISIVGGKSVPQARIGQLCIFLRSES